MRPVPDWVEDLRGVILLVVWVVLVLRVPAARDPRQRPAWVVLGALAVGSVVIQAPVKQWINDVVGIDKAHELVITLVALTDFAAVWWFALVLHAAGHAVPTWLRRAPFYCAAAMAVLAVAFFAVTPPADRYGARAEGWWVGYAVSWIGYGMITAVGASVLFWRHGLTMRDRVLRVSVLALAAGTTAEVPYLVIRAIRWFAPGASPDLAIVGFWFSFTRFVLVALGCSLAALEPLRTALLHWYRRQRLSGLWRQLRAATPELVVTGPESRVADLLAVRNGWERLHQRVVEIRDSISFLHSGWASPELLRAATDHAVEVAPPGRERLTATAAWIEATRRAALAEVPRSHHELGAELLPEVLASESTLRRDVRYLLRLHRALRRAEVRSFASWFTRELA
ncbi:hypothetical protein SAMN05421810_11433 [Amycolatopsis arida]|uniref:DUF6545 domain-containing protein n=1 Tax=Amycolatopsis arida TaxID=587909 RepID=A0A1I6ARJ2_9PSEU|nr:MAB_1171c family putative transporter [Amycolatopsis arida]TDX97590.1 hypothetical protein CLV69_102694 [Amycolatopsis arida]SFQ71242.1 hypothetical protein SAMN05421810_11433 [Amycolatopsis arida]